METIRQNGKTILYSNDGISIKMGFSPGIIEHCRDGEVAGKGTIPNV